MEFFTTFYSDDPLVRELAKIDRLFEPELKRRFSEGELGAFDGTLIYAPVALLNNPQHFPPGKKLSKKKRELVCSPVLTASTFLEGSDQQKAAEYIDGLRGAFCDFKVAGATSELSVCYELVLSNVATQVSEKLPANKSTWKHIFHRLRR